MISIKVLIEGYLSSLLLVHHLILDLAEINRA